MKNLILVFAVISLFSCNSQKKQNNTVENKEVESRYILDLIWESDTLLRTPESVLIDHQRNILYVSNINSGPWEKDGNGFISKMDKSGKIVELKWIEGLSAPKGMGISGNSLFIADIDVLVEASLETGEINNRFPVDGEPQLNDVTVGEDGAVYISGSGSNKIYKLQNGNLQVVFEGDEGERFNGLFWEKDRMLLVTSGSSLFKEIDWENMEAKIISTGMGHGDAICPVGDGSYITTSWAGAVFYVDKNGKPVKILDTEEIGENAADADFSIDDQILYLPTFFKNQVKAYQFVKE
jgi:hypothetical protein